MAGTRLRVVEENSVERLERYRFEWQQLASRVAEPNIFLTYEWVVTWLETFWRDRPLSILFVFEADRLVAVVPLLADRQAELWCRNALVSPVNAHARRGGILSAVDLDLVDVLTSVMRYLLERRFPLKVAVRSVETDSDLLDGLPALQHQVKMGVLVQPDHPSPEVSIDSGWPEYLASRKPRVRHEMRRKRRRMHNACDLRLQIESDIARLPRTLEQVMVIERASWKDPAGSSLMSEGVAEFYARVARRFAERGWLKIYLLFANGVPVAHILGAVLGSTYYALKTSYDHRYRSLAPGAVLMGYALEHAFQSGLRSFDLLGERSRWKGEIATGLKGHWDVCVFSRWAVKCQMCRMMRMYVMPHAKRFMPRAVQWGKRLLGCGPHAPNHAPPRERGREAIQPSDYLAIQHPADLKTTTAPGSGSPR